MLLVGQTDLSGKPINDISRKSIGPMELSYKYAEVIC